MNNKRMSIVKEICNTEAIGCRALNKSSLVFDLMETFDMDTENITISEIPVDWDDQVNAVFEYGGDWYEFAVGISADGSGQYFEEVRRWTEGGDGELMPFSFFRRGGNTMNNTKTMKIGELLKMSDVSIDVYDNVCEELGVAFEWDGTLELTESGKEHFAEALNLVITIGDNNGYAYGVVDVDGAEGVWQHNLKVASEFFYSAAGFCSAEDYDLWFAEKSTDPDDADEPKPIVETVVERLLQTDDGGLDIVKRELDKALREAKATISFDVWKQMLTDILYSLEQKRELTNTLVRPEHKPEPIREPERFLVRVTDRFDERGADTTLKTASEILDWLDMHDCYSELDIEVWRISDGEPTKLELHEAWHKPDDPLYMKACLPDGTVVFDGYGTDH